MTPEQQAALKNIFTRYGSPSRDAEIREHAYLAHPDDLETVERVKRADDNAARAIEEFEAAIKQLKLYRIALAERYNYLATAPTAPVIRLTRHRAYEGNVVYYLDLYSRNLLDGQEVRTERTTFAGKERHAAINAYNGYVAAHPGILHEMDIAKRYWEK